MAITLSLTEEEKKGWKTKKELEEKYETEVLCAPFDVKNKEKVFETINAFPEKWQAIDVLINSAGLALGLDYFDEADISDWETMISTNVTG